MNDSNKFKYGMVFLVMGVLLIVWAWGSWTLRVAPAPAPTSDTIYNTSDETDETIIAETVEGSSKSEKRVNIVAWGYILVVLFTFFIIVLFGSYFLIRAARRYRARTDHDRALPTKYEDVWASHKLPKE